MATTSFFPSADGAGIKTDASYSTAHNSASTNTNSFYTISGQGYAMSRLLTSVYGIYRYFATIRILSSLPDDAAISAASYNVYGLSKRDRPDIGRPRLRKLLVLSVAASGLTKRRQGPVLLRGTPFSISPTPVDLLIEWKSNARVLRRTRAVKDQKSPGVCRIFYNLANRAAFVSDRLPRVSGRSLARLRDTDDSDLLAIVALIGNDRWWDINGEGSDGDGGCMGSVTPFPENGCLIIWTLARCQNRHGAQYLSTSTSPIFSVSVTSGPSPSAFPSSASTTAPFLPVLMTSGPASWACRER